MLHIRIWMNRITSVCVSFSHVIEEPNGAGHEEVSINCAIHCVSYQMFTVTRYRIRVAATLQ